MGFHILSCVGVHVLVGVKDRGPEHPKTANETASRRRAQSPRGFGRRQEPHFVPLTKLLFPFPRSTRFLVYALLLSAKAYLVHSASSESYSAIARFSSSTSTSALSIPLLGPRISLISSTSAWNLSRAEYCGCGDARAESWSKAGSSHPAPPHDAGDVLVMTDQVLFSGSERIRYQRRALSTQATAR